MKNNKKHNITYGVIAVVTSLIIMGSVVLVKQPSFASWITQEDGTRYEKENGEYAVGFMDIDEKRYYFDENGLLVKGKFYVKDEDAYYYSDESGVVQNGVIKSEKEFYITDEAARIRTGFVDYENQRYYFNSNADIVTGWFKYEGNWYYADDKGAIMTGFLTVDGYRYYLNPDGTRVSDTTITIDGSIYVFNKDGSIDENATTLYPVYEYLNQIRTQMGKNELSMNAKVQACAILRAADLVNGFNQTGEADTIETLLKNRGVSCDGGYEFAYGGLEEYGIDRLMEDMKKDLNLQQILKQDNLSEAGLGIYEKDGIYYYDMIFIMRGEDDNEKSEKQ